VLFHHVVRMCKELGARVVAEGIETVDELKAVPEGGADFGQQDVREVDVVQDVDSSFEDEHPRFVVLDISTASGRSRSWQVRLWTWPRCSQGHRFGLGARQKSFITFSTRPSTR
jgi:hypothetical protein